MVSYDKNGHSASIILDGGWHTEAECVHTDGGADCTLDFGLGAA